MCCWASSIYWLSLRPSTGHNTHAILFDAGSSGTRIEIYKFLASGPSLQPSDVLQIDTSPNKVKPKISDFSDDPTQVEAYMNPLLESAKQTIPEDKQVSTPIFLRNRESFGFLSCLRNIGAVCSDCDKNTVNPGKIRLSSNSFCKRDYCEIDEKNPLC